MKKKIKRQKRIVNIAENIWGSGIPAAALAAVRYFIESESSELESIWYIKIWKLCIYVLSASSYPFKRIYG